MSEVSRLKRVLLSLPELALRVGWLREQLNRPPTPDAAELLNELCEQSERADPGAREAQLAVALALVSLGECQAVDSLRKLAEARRLFGLERMLRRSAEAAPHGQEANIPDYGAGRELTVGERRSLARRPSRAAFEKLLADPHPLVIRQLLHNPKLTENDVVRMAARRPARAAVLDELAQAPGWLCRRRVRMSILLNPGSPARMTMPLLGTCTRTELREIIESTDSPLLLRGAALELFERRPPLRSSATGEPMIQ
jgi:hypothetical protein